MTGLHFYNKKGGKSGSGGHSIWEESQTKKSQPGLRKEWGQGEGVGGNRYEMRGNRTHEPNLTSLNVTFSAWRSCLPRSVTDFPRRR